MTSPTSENGLAKAPNQHTWMKLWHSFQNSRLETTMQGCGIRKMLLVSFMILLLWLFCGSCCKICKCITFHHIVFLLLIQWARQLIEFKSALKNVNSMKENIKHVHKHRNEVNEDKSLITITIDYYKLILAHTNTQIHE